MLNQLPYYHGTIRKAVVAFGHLFSSIYIDRKSGGSVEGTTEQRVQVPIAYVNKEKWNIRLEQDESLEHYILTSLPRIGFEIGGVAYDASRKVNKMNQITCTTADSSKSVYAPVPYTLTMNMYIVTGTQEDAFQIVEKILPVFTPTYTMRIRALNPMEINSEVPITLTAVNTSDTTEGSFLDPRLVTWMLTFTMKVDVYGPITTAKPIYHVIVNLSQNESMTPLAATYHADGDPETYEIVDEGWLEFY